MEKIIETGPLADGKILVVIMMKPEEKEELERALKQIESNQKEPYKGQHALGCVR